MMQTQEEIIARANKAVTNAFESGAEFERKRLIEKACKWLEENIDLVAMDTVNARSGYHKIVMMKDFEQKFREAMEL